VTASDDQIASARGDRETSVARPCACGQHRRRRLSRRFGPASAEKKADASSRESCEPCSRHCSKRYCTSSDGLPIGVVVNGSAVVRPADGLPDATRRQSGFARHAYDTHDD
jgi:hypothetical protein